MEHAMARLSCVNHALAVMGMESKAQRPQIRYDPAAAIDPVIRELHPELAQAAYIIVDRPRDKVIVLSLGEALILDEYQLKIILIAVGEDESSGQLYVDLDINFSGRDTYFGTRQTPNGACHICNPRNYSASDYVDLLPHAERVYRTHRYCTGEINRGVWNDGLAIIELSGGYRNYIGRSRFYEQCLLDRSFDTYYEEHCDFGILRLLAGIIYTLPAFNFCLAVENSQVNITIADRGNQQYQPIDYEPLVLTPGQSQTSGRED